MRKFIKRYIRRNCGNVKVEQDVFGNLLCTKGDGAEFYPCLASHMDQVQHNHSKDFQVVEGNDVVFGYSAKSREQQGLGADDKNGIYICLECLKAYDDIKVAFFVEEETGCIGSRSVDVKFFEDCRYIIQPDRRGGNDLITEMFCGDVCSEEFTDAIGYKEYGYSPAHGSVTDVGELVERKVGISCLNLSCGYYEAHTDCEFTVLSELQNCLDFVRHIIDTCIDVYPFEYVDRWDKWNRKQSSKTYNYGSYFGKSGNYVSYGGYGNYGHGSYKDEYDYDDYSYYTENFYDDDLQAMELLLASDESLTLDDILNDWMCNFYTRSRDTIEELYNTVKEYKYDNDEFWNGADDEIVFDTMKVS